MRKKANTVRGCLMMVIVGLLVACGGSVPATHIPSQQWGDIVFEVQTRPEAMQAGMNEFLIIATELRGKPVYNLIISVRVQSDEPWRQTIQDGHSGVYRRALNVPASATALAVQIRHKGDETGTELQFPLSLDKTLR